MNDQHTQEQALDLENPDRRAFTVQSILALFSGVVITVVGCGDDDDSPTSPSGGDVNGTVAANHGHTATISSAQLSAGGGVSLQIRGTATHPHTVDLSAQEISQISARQRVTKTSSSDDSPDAGRHSHTVTFN